MRLRLVKSTGMSFDELGGLFYDELIRLKWLTNAEGQAEYDHWQRHKDDNK